MNLCERTVSWIVPSKRAISVGNLSWDRIRAACGAGYQPRLGPDGTVFYDEVILWGIPAPLYDQPAAYKEDHSSLWVSLFEPVLHRR